MKKNNKKLFAIAGVLALLVVAGVFAYFFQSASIDNPLHTKAYGGDLVEKFTPEEDWEPGEEVDKVVNATNTGDYDLIVRVRFDEVWEREGSAIEGTALGSEDTGFFPAEATTAEESTVFKKITTSTDWVFCGDDGYYYYQKILAPGASTPALLESLTLCADTDMGTYTNTKKYALVDAGGTAPKAKDYTLTEMPTGDALKGKDLYQKEIVALDPTKAGFAKADYTLTVTVDFCQADAAAATAQNWKDTTCLN